ncbi:unnamed protein product [Boreogadus saida]
MGFCWMVGQIFVRQRKDHQQQSALESRPKVSPFSPGARAQRWGSETKGAAGRPPSSLGGGEMARWTGLTPCLMVVLITELALEREAGGTELDFYF